MADRVETGGPVVLEVLTPARRVLRDAVEAVVVPGRQGLLGVLPRHSPMLVILRAGVVLFRREGRKERLAVSGGVCQVLEDRVLVLADAAELAHDIDVLRARAARDRALARLRSRSAQVDEARARAAFERAVARLRAAGADKS
ncbi:MAG: F0F1 ATP synthase subunit epsilon [Bacillota bacterium]|nr:F0F1 ATP synthase subunit epsilon [Bacillota bacterium]